LQNKGMATKTIAVSLALTAFAVAVVAGLMAGNPAAHVLKVALFSMIVCHVVGVFVGMISEHAVSDYIAQVQRANPIPDVAKELERSLGDVGDDVIEV
jgi:putative Mn2+ efflux pump MntP